MLGNRKDLGVLSHNPRSHHAEQIPALPASERRLLLAGQESGKQGSLRTKDRKTAEKLVHTKNEAHRLPTLNLTMARAYLAAHDSKMSTRTWMAVMREMGTHGIASTKTLRAGLLLESVRSIRNKPLVQTTAEDLLSILHSNGHSVAHYLRRLHNLACDLGRLAWPILAKRVWPKIRSKHRRAVTTEEHARIIASEKNTEKRAYYEFLYETGAAQSDAAELTAENIDWQKGCLFTIARNSGRITNPRG